MNDTYESARPPPLPSLPPPTGEAMASLGRRTIAIGGGRGGVGKTLLTINLGVYFAQLGREVILCDADPFGSDMHTPLGLESPPFVDAESFELGHVEAVATSVPGLKILPTVYDRMTGAPRRPMRGAQWLRHIQTLESDYVLVNLGTSTSAAALDLFLQSDIGICVSAPEARAIEATYRFCRALYARSLRRALMRERFKIKIIERAAATLPPLASPRDLIREVRRFDEAVALTAAEQLVQLGPRLVVGHTRVRADLELGSAMAVLSERFLGIGLDYLGHVEHDDAVWLTARRNQPLLIESATSKSARNVERIARRILALLAAQPGRSDLDARVQTLLRPALPGTLYDVLRVSRTATDDEIRRACKRQREVFREGSLPCVSVVSEQAVRDERTRIEEAHETLLDPVRRRAYDVSTFPDDPALSAPAPNAHRASSELELESLQADLAREITPDTIFSGALLRRVREALGIELSDIARSTKISVTHLTAIENDASAELPAHVYVQGFVQQIAKLLKLDPAQVSRTYMRALRQSQSAPPRNDPGR